MYLIGDKEVTCQSTGWITASGTMPQCRKSGKCETESHITGYSFLFAVLKRYFKITKLICFNHGLEY